MPPNFLTTKEPWRADEHVERGRASAPASVLVIPKASSSEHAADNAGAGRLRLTEAELARIDDAFPRGPKPRQLPTL